MSPEWILDLRKIAGSLVDLDRSTLAGWVTVYGPDWLMPGRTASCLASPQPPPSTPTRSANYTAPALANPRSPAASTSAAPSRVVSLLLRQAGNSPEFSIMPRCRKLTNRCMDADLPPCSGTPRPHPVCLSWLLPMSLPLHHLEAFMQPVLVSVPRR